jgi:hypothetical protein
MRSHVLWGVVWALPAIVAIVSIPIYFRLVRTRHLSVLQAIAVPGAVIVVIGAILVATIMLSSKG